MKKGEMECLNVEKIINAKRQFRVLFRSWDKWRALNARTHTDI